MKALEIFLYFCLFVFEVRAESANHEEEDYYWKEYSGTIPKDALPGGNDKDGKTTYIGQAFFQDDILIPGEINAERKILVYAMNSKEFTATAYVKIFCAHNHKNYQWIDTNVTHIRFLTQNHLIPGGYDDGYPLLIGRIEWEGKMVVGKVTINKDYEAFAFATDGESKYVKAGYQVLVYNPKLPYKVITNTVKTECGDKIYNINFY